MFNESPSAANPAAAPREQRRQQILAALRTDADALLERMADELAALPEDKAFGTIEYTLRDLGHELATKAHQASFDTGKKRGTLVPASFARTVTRMRAS
jgi:hypothetical protein